MAWTRGDVVLIPFPFSDLNVTKTRPAVVVNIPEYQEASHEVILAYLTSQVLHGHTDFDYLLIDWQKAGLLKPTRLRARLAVVHQTLIQHHIGTLSKRDLAEVDLRLRRVLSLT